MGITCGQAAQRWGISRRRVQMYCRDGRVPGACKTGGQWLLPESATKPLDPRREPAPMPTAYWPQLLLLDSAMASPADMSWTQAQSRQIEAELLYMQGSYQEAARHLEEALETGPGCLSALTLHAAALVSSGDAGGFPAAWNRLSAMGQAHANHPQSLCLVELAQGLLAVSAYALDSCPPWLLAGSLAPLPPEALPLAMYVRAKALHAQGRLEALAGLADTALCLIPGEGVLKAYMHLMHAHVALYHHQFQQAEASVHRAIDICLPQGLVSPLAETIPSLLGLVERCLKARSPQMLQQAVLLHRQLATAWLKVHNFLARKQLTLLLTRREYQVALAASTGQSNQRCALQLGMSTGTFKGHLEVIYQKLQISSRKSLKDFVQSD